MPRLPRSETTLGPPRNTDFLPVEGENIHQLPVGPGSCRHYRAGAFPHQRRWRDRGAPRGTSRLHPQRNRGPPARRRSGAGGAIGVPLLRRFDGRLWPGICARSGSGAWLDAARTGRLAARADGGTGAPRKPSRRCWRDLQRWRVRHHARPLFGSEGTGASGSRRLLRAQADDGPHRARRRHRRYRPRWRRTHRRS